MDHNIKIASTSEHEGLTSNYLDVSIQEEYVRETILINVIYEKLSKYITFDEFIKKCDSKLARYLTLKERSNMLFSWSREEIVDFDEQNDCYYDDIVVFTKMGEMMNDLVEHIGKEIKNLETNDNSVIEYNRVKSIKKEYINLRLYESKFAPFQYRNYGNSNRFEFSVFNALNDDKEFNQCWFYFLCGEIYKEAKIDFEEVKHFNWKEMITKLDYLLRKIHLLYSDLIIPEIDLNEDNIDNHLTPYVYSFYAGLVNEDITKLMEKDEQEYKVRAENEKRSRKEHYNSNYIDDESMVMAALINGNGEYFGY